MSTKEQNRLQILNGVLERYWSMQEAAPLLGVSERQGWRLLAAYRRESSRGGDSGAGIFDGASLLRRIPHCPSARQPHPGPA